mgnify:CR=1 FL=1
MQFRGMDDRVTKFILHEASQLACEEMKAILKSPKLPPLRGVVVAVRDALTGEHIRLVESLQGESQSLALRRLPDGHDLDLHRVAFTVPLLLLPSRRGCCGSMLVAITVQRHDRSRTAGLWDTNAGTRTTRRARPPPWRGWRPRRRRRPRGALGPAHERAHRGSRHGAARPPLLSRAASRALPRAPARRAPRPPRERCQTWGVRAQDRAFGTAGGPVESVHRTPRARRARCVRSRAWRHAPQRASV